MSFKDKLIKELIDTCKGIQWSIKQVLDEQTIRKEIMEIRKRMQSRPYKP